MTTHRCPGLQPPLSSPVTASSDSLPGQPSAVPAQQPPLPMPPASSTAPPDRQRLLAALERFERPLIAFARSVCGDIETARDAVQDTFLRLARQPPAGEVESLAPWLFTVCRNRLISLQRKNQRLIPMETLTLPDAADPAPSPAAQAESREASSRLSQIIATLPARQQDLLRLKFHGGLSYRDIAAATGLSVTNVGTLLHQALDTLRRRYAAAESLPSLS
ncbi:MAG: family polymerase sigma factor [Verrucomicrobiales bacterium]|nr:family polymerase sigma factor [Verrucomicrobiales bacterium]